MLGHEVEGYRQVSIQKEKGDIDGENSAQISIVIKNMVTQG